MSEAEPRPPLTPLSILICALGGEGGGVLAQWLVETATHAGHRAQGTSIPGVAQRTGATTYYVEIAREPASAHAAAPVFSLYAVPGAVDVVVASELLEATRQVALGFVTPERTCVIASPERTLTTFEKMQLADGRADAGRLLAVLRGYGASLHLVDAAALASRAATATSAVLLGAIAGSGILPFARADFEATIRASGRGVEASLAGFDAGFASVAMPNVAGARRDAPPASFTQPSLPIDLPDDVREIVAAGHARMIEFQDAGYAKRYLDRVERIAAAERSCDDAGVHGLGATRETARFLGAWMAFDDIVRVADLKSRASRLERVRREVKCGGREVLRVYDHFKPGVPEFGAVAPAWLAEIALRWDRRRVRAGRQPFAMALKLPTHSIAGMLALRLVASLRWLRPLGKRFAAEQVAIERWLAAIEAGFAKQWALGHEIALCGRLVKGYGATAERGAGTLLHILEHLAVTPQFADVDARVAAIRAAREAALADDAGRALDRALVAHGAPALPVKAQPIRFVRRTRAPASRKAA